MANEWRVRPMRRDGAVVWVIYRLADSARPDEHSNRAYWPRGECPGWAEREDAARHMAGILNQLDQLRQKKSRPPAGEHRETAKQN